MLEKELLKFSLEIMSSPVTRLNVENANFANLAKQTFVAKSVLPLELGSCWAIARVVSLLMESPSIILWEPQLLVNTLLFMMLV